MTTALAHGVPIVQAGRSEEKGDIGARISYSGAGVGLSCAWPHRRLQRAVHAVLTEPGYRRAARRLADEFAEVDAARDGARYLADLAAAQSR